MTRFRRGAHIGSGGFGTVDEATEVTDDGTVVRDGLAQKTLLDRWAHDKEALARFKREVRMLDEMDHPNIITLVGRNLSADPPWFVTPRAESNLDDEIHANGHAGDREWAVQTFREVLRGMAYAHSSRRVVHRDLKPANVLMINGAAVVSDLGLGKRLDTNTIDVTQSHIGMGTLPYMAPEQLTDAARVGYPADCYALGKILREMLTGKCPPVGAMQLDDVPADFRSFIERCVAEDPADRYANAADALAAFDLLIASSTSPRTDPARAGLELLLKEWEELPEGEDREKVHEIAEYLIARREDEDLYFQSIPRLPRLLIGQLYNMVPEEFDQILTAYDHHTQGALPFGYCDVLANFYRDVFETDASPQHRRMLLGRLVELGPTHNRWHVGDVVAEILSAATGDTADLVANVIRADPSHAHWYRDYTRNRPLAPAVQRALDEVDPSTPADWDPQM